jgi:Alginate export
LRATKLRARHERITMMNKVTLSRSFLGAVLVAAATPALAQQPVAQVISASSDSSGSVGINPDAPGRPASAPKLIPKVAPEQHKLGPLNITVNWRFRSEAWGWFESPAAGQNAYAFEHSLLRIGLGQKTERFEWFVEGAQDAILNLPTAAVLPGALGQLGLGGTYYAANGNRQNNANSFVRQAYIGLALPANAKLSLGRFTFLDAAEVTPKDKSLASLVNTRISQRLIGDFGFSAVGRSFDGAQLSFNTKAGNFTFLGARPTRGVYQTDAMGELSVDLFYGAYTAPANFGKSSAEFRAFGLGYVDERSFVLKTDNRLALVRSTDHDHIRIGTFGADYVQVFNTQSHGKFDFLLWGAVQNGSWGVLAQHSGAFVGEAGWQPDIHFLNPWFRLGYSYGSGDSDPTDGRHGTFFQILPTPRPYARFPFYNMMNNEDFFASSMFRLPHFFVLRSELHGLRLADSTDLWYGGGGAFQPHSFGYTARSTGGNRSLANVWDVSMDMPLRYGFSLTTYYAHAWGKSAITKIYPSGTNAQFGYVETNFHF